ncbi:hypothetical protein Tco_1114706 [Tanacetum coccineum]|uniref:Uncharacterized protein n=1 Tax=Tanacetum coccineum TaxID=301880 RepID=A0ABQ5IYU7_9ASTR
MVVTRSDLNSGRVSERRICPFCLNDDGGVENGREVFVAMDSYQLFINGKDLLGTGGFLDIILGLILAACFSFGSPELFFHPRDPGGLGTPNITRVPSFCKLLLIVIETTKTTTKPPKLETLPVKFRFGGVDGGISNVGSGSGGCGGGRVCFDFVLFIREYKYFKEEVERVKQ